MCLGRAFQIQDDIIGTFGKETQTGKSSLTDLKEAKRTLLIWYAFRKACAKNKTLINKVMTADNAGRPELELIKGLIRATGALDYAEDQIKSLFKKAQKDILSLGMREEYKNTLNEFSRNILKI